MKSNVFRKVIPLIMILLVFSCENKEKSKQQKNIELKESKNNNSISKEVNLNDKLQEKLPENYLVFNSDTIIVADEGKVRNVKMFNSEIYYYMLFIPTKPETGIGEKYIKVKDKRGKLLWSKNYDNKIILSDEYRHIIFLDVENNNIDFYDIEDGKRVISNVLSESYVLGDANEFVATKDGIFIKLVNDEDYKFEDVLFVNPKNGSERLLDLSEFKGQYVNLRKINDKVIIIDTNGNELKSLSGNGSN